MDTDTLINIIKLSESRCHSYSDGVPENAYGHWEFDQALWDFMRIISYYFVIDGYYQTSDLDSNLLLDPCWNCDGPGWSDSDSGSSGSSSSSGNNTVTTPSFLDLNLLAGFANHGITLDSDQINWINQSQDNADSAQQILDYLNANPNNPQAESFANLALEALMDDYIENFTDIPITISPEIPINNISDFIECFDSSLPARLTIYVDQPIPNSNVVVSINSVGHSFIGITQGDNTSTFGFYPNSDNTSPWNTEAPPIFGDDSSHPFDVSLTINISASQLNNILNLAINFNDNYDLNDNNCTDFAIQTANLGGLNIDECNSSWLLGSGSNPAKLGQTIRNMDNLPIDSERNTDGGYPPDNNKDC